MTAFFVKAVLAGSLLYILCSLGEASFAKVATLTSSVVDQTVNAHVQKDIFGHGKQFRYKREVASKTLDDPKGCLNLCRSNETADLTSAVLRNTARLVALALQDIKGDETKTPEKEAAFKKRIEEKTIANMGPLFDDLCNIHKNSALCYKKCPDSQAQAILTIDNEESQTALCEPGQNWKSFSEYWGALNCTNNTEATKPCENKCGADLSMRNETHLEIVDADFFDQEDDDDSSNDKKSNGVDVKYETDSKKNTAAANRVCKTLSCELDCYKPIITKNCGAKAYDMYVRMQKSEPHTSMAILKNLKAIDQADDCKAYA